MRHFLVALAVAATSLVGCERPVPEITAPKVHFGQAVCAECSMIISDERYAGAIGLRRNGRVVHLLFDDIGEMFEFAPGEYEAIRWFATDGKTREWLDAEHAIFLRSEKLMTPMGTGVGAYATEEAARSVQQEHGGEILRFTDLR